MTDTTANFGLPLIAASQSLKYVSVNEALTALDAVVQISVVDRDLTAPPGAPTDGARYLVAAGATGAWAGKDGNIAAYRDGAWVFYAPNDGWMIFVVDEGIELVCDGGSWAGVSTQNAALIGINTTADATNKLALASAAVLHTHVGNGVQHKLNKAATGDTASLLFQMNWSDRAEIGLCGNDDFSFKVSPDGATWWTGLTLVAGAKGVPKLPGFATGSLPAAATAGAGAMAYDTTLSKLVISNGAAWVAQT